MWRRRRSVFLPRLPSLAQFAGSVGQTVVLCGSTTAVASQTLTTTSVSLLEKPADEHLCQTPELYKDYPDVPLPLTVVHKTECSPIANAMSYGFDTAALDDNADNAVYDGDADDEEGNEDLMINDNADEN